MTVIYELLSLSMFICEYLMVPLLLFILVIYQRTLLGDGLERKTPLVEHIFLSGLEIMMIFCAGYFSLLLREAAIPDFVAAHYKGFLFESVYSFRLVLFIFALIEVSLILYVMLKEPMDEVRSLSRIWRPYRIALFYSFPVLVLLIFVYWINFDADTNVLVIDPVLLMIVTGGVMYVFSIFIYRRYFMRLGINTWLQEAARLIGEQKFDEAYTHYNRARRYSRVDSTIRQASEGCIYAVMSETEDRDIFDNSQQRRLKSCLRILIPLVEFASRHDQAAEKIHIANFKKLSQRLANVSFTDLLISNSSFPEIRKKLAE
jgi:hypothetical protein